MKSVPPRSLQTAILALLILGIIALALGGYLSSVTRLLTGPFVGIQTLINERYQEIQDYIKAPQDVARLRQRNEELEKENSEMKTEIVTLKQQIAETRILEALVDFARANPENRYLAASVIGRDPSPFVKYVIINRGSDDGLQHGMPVVTQQGLVGRITAVTAKAARVLLLVDPSSSVNIRLEPSRSQAVLLGSITGELSLDMIPLTEPLQVGDLVLTSGLGGNYPANILIGQVVSIRRKETNLFQQAVVQPVVDFNQLEIVLVIVNFRPVEIEPLIPTPESP